VPLDQREADLAKDHLVVKGQRYLVEHDDGRARSVEDVLADQGFFNRHTQYINVNSKRVMKKSTASTATDAATTALVVARPTPCVPPRVRRPTWQPMLTMTKPRKNGLISPIHGSCQYRPSSTEVQYTLDSTRNWAVAITHPPRIPTKSATTVSTGHISVPARIRGTTSLRTGSVPSARSALICSATIIDP